jgi:hypothetical protein
LKGKLTETYLHILSDTLAIGAASAYLPWL